jgi:hypothetical protein
MGMTCTICFCDTHEEPDFSNLVGIEDRGSTIAKLCVEWKCADCLNDLDRAAIEQGHAPPSGAWSLVEEELNDCLADIQEGGSFERHKDRIAMLQNLLACRPSSEKTPS